MGHVLPAFFALARPNLQDQIAELASRGVGRIVVLPYFLFQGQHVGVDIPNILAQCHEWFPQVTLELLPTLENDPAVEALVVDRLMSEVGDRKSESGDPTSDLRPQTSEPVTPV